MLDSRLGATAPVSEGGGRGGNETAYRRAARGGRGHRPDRGHVLRDETSKSSAAPFAAKWCCGQKIAFFPGGPAGGVFADNVYNGAQQAAADLGAKVSYVFSDWDPKKMLSSSRRRSLPSPTASPSWATRATPHSAGGGPGRGQGIIVTSQNTELPKLRRIPGQGLRLRRRQNYNAGFLLGKAAVSQLHLKKGDRAMVWGLLSQPTAASARRA